MATQQLNAGQSIGQVDYPLELLLNTSPVADDGVGILFTTGKGLDQRNLAAIHCTATDVNDGQLKGKLSWMTLDEGGDGLVERFAISDSSQILLANGTSGAPSLAFISDTDMGFYRASASNIGFSGALHATTTAGPTLLGETSSATNPTVCPDRTELGSGLGGTANGVSVIALSVEMIDVTSTTVVFPLGYQSTAQSLTPAADGSAASVILPNTTAVDVGAVTNDANDWILLPALANVPVGHRIDVACNAGTAFEIRTPAASNEKINTVDADGGSAELTCVDTELVTLISMGATDGWIARSFTALGADNAALVPGA